VNSTPGSEKPQAPTAARSVPRRHGMVAFAGAGPGGDGLLTLRAAELLGRADLVVGRPEVTGRLAHLLSPGADVVDSARLQQDPELMIAAARDGQLVVRLSVGDPLLFCHTTGEADACAQAGVRLEIVPGVSSATAVPAFAGIPLTEGGADLRVVHASDIAHIARDGHPRDGHSRDGQGRDGRSADGQPGDGRARGTLVVLGAESSPADVAKSLVAAGWPDGTPMAITWNGTTTAQQTVVSKLSSVPADLKAAGISLLTQDGPALAVVGEAAAHQGLSWYESKPLFGWRVLVPRTKEQAASVSERLRSYGAVPEIVPTIAVEPPRTPQQMERAIRGLVTGRFQWIAFTSANAVRAVREKLEEYGLDARAFAGVKVAAVGEQTAAALGQFGIKPDLMPEGEQSGEGLAASWPPRDEVLDPIDRVLLPRADIATETLVARLTELGWEAEDVTAYRTVRAAPPPAPIREAIKGGGFDAVLFTSSSTVRNLIGIAGKPHAVTVVAAIGPQTAQTAAEYGLRVDVRAPKPSASALVDALAEHGAQLREAAIAAGEPVRKPSERRRGARRRLR
jgi:uroporphyrinogen III methyltransferase / synthase